MAILLFQVGSSPSVAPFALKQVAAAADDFDLLLPILN